MLVVDAGPMDGRWRWPGPSAWSMWWFIILMIGIVADLINFNRQLIEIMLEKVRRLELEQSRSRAEHHG
jgi:hypothetical protein